jgi:hypothetical protein
MTELMSCVWPSANETFAFGIMCVETRRIPEKLAWPTWNYDNAMMGITDRVLAEAPCGPSMWSPRHEQSGLVADVDRPR